MRCNVCDNKYIARLHHNTFDELTNYCYSDKCDECQEKLDLLREE